MSELTDDQLDGLFRKSAEEFDPPFDPVAWRDMKTRLDVADRTTTGTSFWNNLLRWGLPVLLLLLITGGMWYTYRRAYPVEAKSDARTSSSANPTVSRDGKNGPSTTARPTTDNEPVRTATVGSKESDNVIGKQPTDLSRSVANPATSVRETNGPADKEGANTLATTSSANATKRPELAYGEKDERRRAKKTGTFESVRVADRNASEKTNYRDKTTASTKSDKLLARRQRNRGKRENGLFASTTPASAFNQWANRQLRSPEDMVARSTPIRSGNNYTDVAPLVVDENSQVRLPALSDLSVRPAKWPRLPNLADYSVTSQPDTTVRKAVSKPRSEHGLSIRALVAPDLSSIGLRNFSRPGTNVGLLLEYRLASRWSVQAGVIQSTKVYRALPEEYAAPYGTWGGTVRPVSIDGRCNMFDIPLNLRYDVILKPQADGKGTSRWFVNGGVTSYIMNQEKYVFNYPPHTYRQRTDTTTSTGGYGFSNLNLSIGYEHALSKRLSWQVEPFIKMPLKGVGFFNIDLLSTGAFFSIRYKLY